MSSGSGRIRSSRGPSAELGDAVPQVVQRVPTALAAATPPQDAAAAHTLYRGELGATRSRAVHVRSGDALISVEVYVSVNADTDPELGGRARGELAMPLHALTVAGEAIELAIPLRYHEPSRALFALVLPPTLRHRELDERTELYRQLAQEPAGTPIPQYVLRGDVVIGAAGLAALRAEASARQATAAALHLDSLAAQQRELELRAAELEQRTSALVRREAALQARQRRHDHRAPAVTDWSEHQDAELSASVTAPSPALDDSAGTMVGRAEHATPDTIDEDLSAGLRTASDALPLGADPVTTEAREEPVAAADAWLAARLASGSVTIAAHEGAVRVALPLGAAVDASTLRGPLDVRLVLHRAASYPVVALLVGSPAALRVGRREQYAACCLDVAVEADRAALQALARRFELVVEVFAAGRVVRRVQLSAPLADNAAYLLRAADSYRQHLERGGGALEFARAREHAMDPEHDLAGAHHRSGEAFRDYQLVQVHSAEQLRGALQIAETFSLPDGEDYLVCVRGFPLLRWRRLRRHVLEQAVTWGIWMGSPLANVAISEGLARSRRDLVQRLVAGFEQLQRHPSACDLDAQAVADNAAALAQEARALNLVPGRSRSLIDSEMDSVVAGTIDLVASGPNLPAAEQSISELLEGLEHPEQRLGAALELCRRGADETAEAVLTAVCRMSRAEAVQVLAHCLTLGAHIERPLIAALRSSKSYIRQGAALTLGCLGGSHGITAMVDLLLSEPTEIWKEIARAIGQVGPMALPQLASAVRDHGASARIEERAAWAMAFLGARDCRRQLVQLSSGHTIMAPIAAKALALVEPAGRDQQALVADVISPEITMNRTFSRQFFAALEEQAGIVHSIGEDHASQRVVLDDRELAPKS